MQKVRGIFHRYRLLMQKVIFALLPNGYSRADYLRKRKILKSIGENVYFYSRIYPSDARLLKIGNNVVVATNVRFLGHDGVNAMLSGMYGKKYTKYLACIEVGNNVFIGADSIILPDVKIGDNSIIGAGAVISKNLPGGFVWGGIPARQIGKFDEFIAQRKDCVSPESNEDKLWDRFELTHMDEDAKGE